jgi:hypothetical protein
MTTRDQDFDETDRARAISREADTVVEAAGPLPAPARVPTFPAADDDDDDGSDDPGIRVMRRLLHTEFAEFRTSLRNDFREAANDLFVDHEEVRQARAEASEALDIAKANQRRIADLEAWRKSCEAAQ